MKFIDDKGRVFGKINIIDFLVVLFLIGLVPLFYLGNKALSSHPVDKNYKKVSVDVKFASIMPELASVLREGDTFKNNYGYTVGVLNKVISDTPSQAISINQLNIRDNNYLLVPNPSVKDVICLFELNCSEEKGLLFFNGYPVKIGSTILLSSDNYDAQGIVISIDRGNIIPEKKVVK